MTPNVCHINKQVSDARSEFIIIFATLILSSVLTFLITVPPPISSAPATLTAFPLDYAFLNQACYAT